MHAKLREVCIDRVLGNRLPSFRFSVFTNKPTKVLPLFDFGDKLGVVFDGQDYFFSYGPLLLSESVIVPCQGLRER